MRIKLNKNKWVLFYTKNRIYYFLLNHFFPFPLLFFSSFHPFFLHMPYCPSVCWSVGRSKACHNFPKGVKFHFHAPIGPLVISFHPFLQFILHLRSSDHPSILPILTYPPFLRSSFHPSSLLFTNYHYSRHASFH